MSEATDVHIVGSTSKRSRSQTPLEIGSSPESMQNETDIQFLGARVKRPRVEPSSEGFNSQAPGPASRPTIRRRSTTNPLRQIDRERRPPRVLEPNPHTGRHTEASFAAQNSLGTFPFARGAHTGRNTEASFAAQNNLGTFPYPRGAVPVSHRRPLVPRVTPPTQEDQVEEEASSTEEDVIDLTSDQSVGSMGSPEVTFVRSRPRTPPSDSSASLSFDYALRPISQISSSGVLAADFNRIYYDAWVNRSPSTRIVMGSTFSRVGPVWRPSAVTFEEQPIRRDFEYVYKAPSPAPSGFTRSLVEDEVAVCPHCDRELGTGEGKKQEIWAAKCGHAYCGECAANRSVKAAQQNATFKPFAVCRIPDCGLRVSAKTAFIQLFV